MNRSCIHVASALLLLAVALFSCRENKGKWLCQKWKTIALKNTTMDKGIQEMKDYIDTLGQHDTELRNTIDIDSAKKSLEQILNETMMEQSIAEKSTMMEFKSNGICYTTSLEGIDSAMYSLDGHLIRIDEATLKGYGETMTFEIFKLTTDSLRLRLIDYGDTSIVTMIPVQ